MSTNPIWTTHCDALPEDPRYPRAENCKGWAEQEDTKAKARATATAYGWGLGADLLPDLCPACLPSNWCPQCDARDNQHCSTPTGRDHRRRTLLMLANQPRKATQ